MDARRIDRTDLVEHLVGEIGQVEVRAMDLARDERDAPLQLLDCPAHVMVESHVSPVLWLMHRLPGMGTAVR